MSRLDTSFPDAEESTGLMLWRVTTAWQAAIRRALAGVDLTHVQFVLLASLAWFPEEEVATQQALAAHAHTDPMMTSQVLRALEAKGLVTRGAHPTDRRARLIAITPEGLELVNRANPAVEACDDAYFAALGDRRREFTRMLGALAAAPPGGEGAVHPADVTRPSYASD